jgi:hypothetical protein
MDSEQMHDLIYKPLTVGAVGGAMSIALIPMDFKIYGMPAPITLGGALALASWASAMSNEAIYENTMSNNESELVYNLTAPVVTGLASSGVVYMMLEGQASSKTLLEFFALGVAAEIGGGYVNESLLGPAMSL